MVNSYSATQDIDVITSNYPVPGLGLVPLNAFLLKGSEPILVDTGSVADRTDFLSVLRSLIDPQELRWIFLTHSDFDHIGSLATLLSDYPQLRVITTFLGVGIMGLAQPLPLDRVHLLNPGETLHLGDRTITAVKPPTFDNPCTTGFIEAKSGVFFSSDSFGALLAAVPQRASDLSEAELRQGQRFWATVDSPWLHSVDRDAYAKDLSRIAALSPSMVLSSHLPPAPASLLPQMLQTLASAPEAPPFVGPNQAALLQMLRQMSGT